MFPTLGLLSVPLIAWQWKISHEVSSLYLYMKIHSPAFILYCFLPKLILEITGRVTKLLLSDLLGFTECCSSGIAFHISRQTFRVVGIYCFVLQSTQRQKRRWKHLLYSMHFISTLVFVQGADSLENTM